MQQPITNPPVPYVGPIQGGFTPGSMIRIQGLALPTADRFDINLNCGPPPSDTALHLSVRLLQNYIARNSLQDGAWGNEEDSGSLPIAPGQSFEILILCDPSSYKIAVNGDHFAEFRHRIPFQQVSHLAINGDVTLRVIGFESGASAPTAPPPSTGGPDYAYRPPPPQYGPPPDQYGPPSGHYGPPPGQYGPPTGPYGQGPYGGGPPRPPGHQEESGFDSFLETAGTVIAGAIASGAAQNLFGGLTGSGGQAQQQHYQPPPPPPPPQQPLFPLGGQGSVGGLGSVGSLLQTFAGQVLSGPKKQQQMPTAPPKSGSSVSMPMPSSVPLPPVSMPMPSSVPLPPASMPMPSSASLPPPHMPPKRSDYMPAMPPTYGPPSQIPPYGAPPSYVPPPSYPTQPMAPPAYPTQRMAPPPYPTQPMAPPSYPTQAPPAYPTQPCPAYQGYHPPMYAKQKKSKLKKAMKYGLPIAGAGLGAYALSHAIHHHGSSSSSSSSDSD